MEAVMVTIGGILILLCVGGGILMQTKLVRTEAPVPTGDRVFAGLIGITLIATAVVIEVKAWEKFIWITLGMCGASTVVYVVYLCQTRPRGIQQTDKKDSN